MSTENSENRNIDNNNEQHLQVDPSRKESDLIASKEDIKPSYFSAQEKAKEWIRLSHNFQNAKKSLKVYRNILLEFVFEKIGYKYKGHIRHPNFLHLCAEAYLLGIFGELEKEINGNMKNLTFNSLINIIANIIVKENTFIDNIEMLIGRFTYLEPFAKEEKIFRSILIDLNSSKNEVLKDDKILKNFELSYEKFVAIMEKILRISFNVFLNNINSNEENKKSNLLYNNFEVIRILNKLTSEEFQKAYISAKNIKEIPNKNLEHQLLGYYEFCLNTYDDFIKEIQVFNKNAASVIYKIFSVLPEMYLFDFIHKRVDFLKCFPGEDFSIKNFRLENMRNYLAEAITDSKCFLSEVGLIAEDTRSDIKKWVKTIPVVQFASNTTNEFYLYFKQNYGEYFNQGISKFNDYFSLFKNVTLAYKETLSAFVFVVFDKSVGSAIYLQRAIFGFIARNFQNLKNALFGKEQLIKVHSDNDHFYSIEINKKLFIINPELFFDFFAMVKGYLGKVYNLKFFAGEIASNVNKKIMEVASDSEKEPNKQQEENNAEKHEKHVKEL